MYFVISLVLNNKCILSVIYFVHVCFVSSGLAEKKFSMWTKLILQDLNRVYNLNKWSELRGEWSSFLEGSLNVWLHGLIGTEMVEMSSVQNIYFTQIN